MPINGTLTIQLNTVYQDNAENKVFWEATPSGNITLQVTNVDIAKKFFTPGREYYVDFVLPEGNPNESV